MHVQDYKYKAFEEFANRALFGVAQPFSILGITFTASHI